MSIPMRSHSLKKFGPITALLCLALGASSCSNQKADDPSVQSGSESMASDTGKLQPHEASLPKGEVRYKRYPLRQAHIHYESSGFRRGTEDLYFTDFGIREARHMNLENLTPEGIRPERAMIVTIGSDMRMADLENKRGTRMKEPVADSLIRLQVVDPPGVISDTILSRMRYTKQGTGTVLDRPVTIWFEPTSGTTLHVWDGLVLKQEVKNPQHQHVVVAVSIDTTTPPESAFQVPDTIEYMLVDPRARK